MAPVGWVLGPSPLTLRNKHITIDNLATRGAASSTSRALIGLPRQARATPHSCTTCSAKPASEGFGSLALPKLPSLSGNKPKVPKGGVLPSPAVDLSIPSDLETAWAQGQREWVQYATTTSIDAAAGGVVVLPAHGGATVHLVPADADSPASAALIREVVAAVQPDALAIESPPQYLKAYTALAKALEPLLAAVMAADLATPTAARSCLTAAQREQWQTLLLQASASAPGTALRPDPEQLELLFRLGNLPFVEWLLPAHICLTSTAAAGKVQQQHAPIFVSCGLDREARGGLFLALELDIYVEQVEAALGEELSGELVAWRTALGDRLQGAGVGRELAELVSTWEAACCVGPEKQREVAERVEEGMRWEQDWEGECVHMEVVRTPGDAAVARRLVELAEGRGVVRPCRRIVAVVGRSHLLSVEAELRKLAATGR